MAKAADSTLEALEKAGLFSDEVKGSISVRNVTEACTYLG
jgi:succinate dehydrogenase/fumarate reductase flavoprotein subunit